MKSILTRMSETVCNDWEFIVDSKRCAFEVDNIIYDAVIKHNKISKTFMAKCDATHITVLASTSAECIELMEEIIKEAGE